MARLNGKRPAETFTRDGGRRIELFMRFRWHNRLVDHVDIAPLRLDHVLRWQEGEFKSAVALMAEMAGMSVELIRQLRYPDTDRVMAAFLEMLPEHIRADVANGVIPLAPVAKAEPAPELPRQAPQPEMKESGWPKLGTDEGGDAEAAPIPTPEEIEALADEPAYVGPRLPLKPPFGPPPKKEPTLAAPPPPPQGDPADEDVFDNI